LSITSGYLQATLDKLKAYRRSLGLLLTSFCCSFRM